MAPSIVSLLTTNPKPWIRLSFWVEFLNEDWEAGEGIISGFDNNKTAEPVNPTNVEKMNPGLERSMMYQRAGLTSAKVSDACKVEVQGSFLCETLAYGKCDLEIQRAYNSKSNPHKSSYTPYNRSPVRTKHASRIQPSMFGFTPSLALGLAVIRTFFP